MEYIRIVVTCAAAIAAGIMLGNSAVVFFNRMPGKWLCEYGKEPDEELVQKYEEKYQKFRKFYPALKGMF